MLVYQRYSTELYGIYLSICHDPISVLAVGWSSSLPLCLSWESACGLVNCFREPSRCCGQNCGGAWNFQHQDWQLTIEQWFFLGAWVLYTNLGYLRSVYAGLRRVEGRLRRSTWQQIAYASAYASLFDWMQQPCCLTWMATPHAGFMQTVCIQTFQEYLILIVIVIISNNISLYRKLLRMTMP